MSDCLLLQSPAKLNLMLHITGQREDGYHNLQTVFQFIELFDELEFKVTDDGCIRRVHASTEVAEENDLVIKAARLLQQRFSVPMGVDISIQKRIPMGGGLGGGSSDAATTLMALNRLWKLGLNQQELQSIGIQLGADVPVFIHGQSAWAEGIGDELTTIDLPEPWYLIIHPYIFVSTADIFAAKELTRDCHPLTIRAFLEGRGSNVCEAVACKLYPEIQQAIDWLNQFSPTRMTGTGACIFAAFGSADKAKFVLSQLPEIWNGYVARGLNINPVAKACFDTGKN